MSALDAQKTVLLKLGGNAIDDASVMDSFADAVVTLRGLGARVVVSHGAGPQIDARLANAGIVSERVDGHRVTSVEAMAVIHDVMVNEMQKALVDAINRAAERVQFLIRPLASGMSPEGTRLFRCKKHEGRVDFQCVGDITFVDSRVVEGVLAKHRVPVVTGLGIGETDHKALFNINADWAAAALAGRLKVDEFVMISNVPGLYRDFATRSGLIDTMTVSQARQMVPFLEGGMVPKVQASVDAIEAGAKSALMMSADDLGALSSVIFQGQQLGTKVVKDAERPVGAKQVARPLAERNDAVVSITESDTYSG